MASNQLRVYLSYTQELIEHPAAGSFIEALRAAAGRWSFVQERSANTLQGSDVFVSVVGFLYGAVDEDTGRSLAEADYRLAGVLGIERLVFLLGKDTIGPASMFVDPDRGADQDAFRRELRAAGAVTAEVSSPEDLAAAVSKNLERVAATRTQRWNILPYPSMFVGRQQLLDRMSGSETMLVGPSGIGKSALARAYATELRKRLGLGWWISCSVPEAIPSALAELADVLGAREGNDPATRVRTALRDRDDWLLILDDVVDPETIRPFRGLPGRLMVTSNLLDLPGRTLFVGPTSPKESEKLLRLRLPQHPTHQLRTIVEAAEGHPATLLTAAADVRRDPQGFKTTNVRALAQGLALGTGRHVGPVVALAESDSLEWTVLALASWLGPGPIPLRLLLNHLDIVPSIARRVRRARSVVSNVPDRLQDLGLAEVVPAGLMVHPIIATVVRDESARREHRAESWVEAAVEVLSRAVPSDKDRATALWTRLLPHVVVACGRVSHSQNSAPIAGFLLERAASHLRAIGDTRAAKALFNQRNRLVHAVGVTRTDNVLARLEETFREAAYARGATNRDTLGAATDYANALRDEGRYSEAVALLSEVLQADWEFLEKTEPWTLTAAGTSLATMLIRTGRAEEALALQERVVQVASERLGSDHPEMLAALTNLALALLAAHETSGDRAILDRAIAQLDRVAHDGMQVLGSEHPTTLLARISLAAALAERGDLKTALAFAAEAVAGYRVVLGRDHPDTLTAETNLAAFHSQAGNTHEAVYIGEDVLDRFRAILGEDHPSTLFAANNLADDYRKLGEFRRALELDQDTHDRFLNRFGPEHPNTLGSRRNLALDRKALGLLEGGEEA